MNLPAALLRALDWLFGTGSGVLYKGTCPTDSWPELCARTEEIMRAMCLEEEGYSVRATVYPYSCFVRAYQGLIGGLAVNLIPQKDAAGGSSALVSVNRWSRLHSFGIQVAIAVFFQVLLGSIVAVALAGWQVPFIGWILLGVSVLVTILVMRFLFFFIDLLAWRGQNENTEERAETLVTVIRMMCEAGSLPAASPE